MSNQQGPGGPEAMREVVRDYVLALHATYLDHARHLPPGERAALPLAAAERLTVVAAATRRLHLVATADAMPPVQGQEVELHDEHGGVRWNVRFLDATILPELGLVADDSPREVRRLLGVTDAVYHLTVDVGGGLSAHHAQHSGVALANRHAATHRDVDRLRALLPRQTVLVDELAVCVRLGLDRAAGLLVAQLSGGRVPAAPDTPAEESLAALLTDASPR